MSDDAPSRPELEVSPIERGGVTTPIEERWHIVVSQRATTVPDSAFVD